MSIVLQLQKLTPVAGTDMNLVLMSTYSGICPDPGERGNFRIFEMD